MGNSDDCQTNKFILRNLQSKDYAQVKEMIGRGYSTLKGLRDSMRSICNDLYSLKWKCDKEDFVVVSG